MEVRVCPWRPPNWNDLGSGSVSTCRKSIELRSNLQKIDFDTWLNTCRNRATNSVQTNTVLGYTARTKLGLFTVHTVFVFNVNTVPTLEYSKSISKGWYNLELIYLRTKKIWYEWNIYKIKSKIKEIRKTLSDPHYPVLHPTSSVFLRSHPPTQFLAL